MKVSAEVAIKNGAEFKAFNKDTEKWYEIWDYEELVDGYIVYHYGPTGFTINKSDLVIVDSSDINEGGNYEK